MIFLCSCFCANKIFFLVIDCSSSVPDLNYLEKKSVPSECQRFFLKKVCGESEMKISKKYTCIVLRLEVLLDEGSK